MKIKQLHEYENGTDIEVAPVTIPDAVVNPDTQENLTDALERIEDAIPTKVSQLTNDSGFTKNTGTITGIKMNGSSKGTSGVVDLGTVITAHQDISGKLDATVAASTYLTKTDAASTYLGKTAKAASATTADSATKATKDGSGNTITSTYATKTALSGLQTQIDTLVSGNASSAIESFNEITAFLEGVEDTGTLDGIIAGINTEIGKKADKSSAITNITRSGTTFTATRADGTTFTFTQQDSDTTYSSKAAASGGTAVSLVTTGEKYTWNSKASTAVASTSANGLMSKSDKSKLDGIASGAEVNVQSDWSVTDTSSDAYIKNKPTIPSAVTESTVSGWGFTKNTGTYSKPSTGIPKTDLASAVQTSLGKADTALQSHQDISGKLDVTTAASTYLSKTDAASTYLGKTAKAASATTADSATKATKDGSGNTITSTYAAKTELASKQDKILKFENMVASNWVADSTYSDFGYHCDMTCTGATDAMFAEVVFSQADAVSGDYAMVCETMTDVVRIYSKKNVSITVPTIIIHK